MQEGISGEGSGHGWVPEEEIGERIVRKHTEEFVLSRTVENELCADIASLEATTEFQRML